MLNPEELIKDIAAVVESSPELDTGMNFPDCIEVDKKDLVRICGFLHDDDRYYFDQLSSLTGIDNGAQADTMDVIYHLYSIPFDYRLALKVILPRASPQVDSVVGIWRTANWHEREAYDLLGIHFNNHPDLRRILLPLDWEGYPLRKDYKEQEKYHGMTVKYDRDDYSEIEPN